MEYQDPQTISYDLPIEVFSVILNQNTSAAVIRSLSNISFDVQTVNDAYKVLISRHHNTPEDVLDTLASDPHPDIRYFVSKNPNATDEIKQLVKDNDKKYTVSVN
jgi:hypothetical protein